MEQEVLTLVKKYYAVDEAIATDRQVPLNRYYEVAGGSYAQDLLRGAQAQRAKGYRVIGKIKVGHPEIHRLRLSNSKGRLPSATVKTCLDVSGVNVVDAKGKSVVRADRGNAYMERLTVRKESYGWRVVDGEDTEIPKCDS